MPFTKTAYTPSSFFSTLLSKSSTIKSAAYQGSFSLDVGKRDVDAVPFQIITTNAAALRQQYQNDAQRAKDVTGIIAMLNSSYSSNNWPSSLKTKLLETTKKNSYYKNTSIADPVTNKEYPYQVVNGGKDFNLTVTFETDDAIKSIRRSVSYQPVIPVNTNGRVIIPEKVSDTTIISGKTVTFTKNSPNYLYLAAEPPKPLLVQLGESMSQLPADVKVSVGVEEQADFTNASTGINWLMRFNAEGAFGDLTYKINAEARKKDANYYVRINNIPSLFGSYSLLKGQWISISATPTTSTSNAYNSGGEVNYLLQSLQSTEKNYKEQRQSLITILQKAAEIADSENLVTFKNTPKQENVDGRNLTRYELQIRKEAILPFYQKLVAEVNKNSALKQYGQAIADQGTVEYLQSNEFNQVFEYLNKNIQLTFWTDSSGYPAILEEKMRIVPADTAVQLKGKQVNVVLKLKFNDINKPVNIQVPDGAKSYTDVMKDLQNNMYGYDNAGESRMKSNLSNVRAGAEIVYVNSKNSYGNKPFVVGACKQTAGTMFADNDLFTSIQAATDNVPSKATCASAGPIGKVNSYAVSAPLLSDPTYSWCVDSTGVTKQIKGAIKSSICK